MMPVRPVNNSRDNSRSTPLLGIEIRPYCLFAEAP